MHKIVPHTLFVGQQVVYLPACTSTNSEAQQLFLKNNATDGAMVVTDNQTAGRGQRGNTWEAEPGQNLTLSVLLRPTFLPVREQFYLTIVASLALADLLRPYLPDEPQIKWPNDLLVNGHKMAGILIENTLSGSSLQASVIGIGLNVNQVRFATPSATSLHLLTGKPHHLPQLIAELAQHLEKRYLQLRQGNRTALKRDYLAHLYRYQEPHLYLIDGQLQQAILTGVDETGHLALQIGADLRYFDLKEVVFV